MLLILHVILYVRLLGCSVGRPLHVCSSVECECVHLITLFIVCLMLTHTTSPIATICRQRVQSNNNKISKINEACMCGALYKYLRASVHAQSNDGTSHSSDVICEQYLNSHSCDVYGVLNDVQQN